MANITIKMELNNENALYLLSGFAKLFFADCNVDERETVLQYVADMFCDGEDGEAVELNDLCDFISDEREEIVSELGYEDYDLFRYIKDNDITDDYLYRKDGEFYDACDIEDKFDRLEQAAEDALWDDFPFCDWEEYAEEVFEVIENPNAR